MHSTISMKWVVKNLAEAGSFLLGRRTYDVFAAYWPNAPAEEQALAQPLNTRPKYLACAASSPAHHDDRAPRGLDRVHKTPYRPFCRADRQGGCLRSALDGVRTSTIDGVNSDAAAIVGIGLRLIWRTR
jgi:hypothetical protein